MKGFWRTIESVLAAMIIVTFLLTVGSVYFQAGDVDMSSTGYEILKELEVSGNLRNYAFNSNYSALSSDIHIPGYNHSVKICDHAGNCSGVYPDSYNVQVATYIIAGDDAYGAREVRLYIWR